MRRIALALASMAVLAACNPSAQAPAPDDSIFPNLNASYRAEGTIAREGNAMPVVMIRRGRSMRMEFSSPQGQSIIISNGDTGESYIVSNAGGRQVAMRSAANDAFEDPTEMWGDGQALTRGGSCSGAGESGTEWANMVEGIASTACVTGDGILLYAEQNGARTWEAASVQRGPQPAELFTLPPGVQVMDLNNIPGMADAIERARAVQN
jgi:hypothetical protein